MQQYVDQAESPSAFPKESQGVFVSEMPFERERDFYKARDNALSLLKALDIAVESTQVGDHVWIVSLDRLNAEGAPITGAGKGRQACEAEVGALFEAIEHLALTEYVEQPGIRCVPLDSKTIDSVWKQRMGLVAPIVAEQAGHTMTMAEFSSLSGKELLLSPLGLHCPVFVRDTEKGDVPDWIRDVFDYRCLRKYSSSNGMAAGSTMAEALIHAISEIIERQAVGDFLLRVLGSDRGCVDVIDPGSLDPALSELIARASDVAGADVHLIDVTADTNVPTFVSYAAHDNPDLCCMTMGASLYPDYAAARSITELIQAVEVIAKERSRGGRSLAERNRIMYSRFAQAPVAGFDRFRPSRLTEILTTERVSWRDFRAQLQPDRIKCLDDHIVALEERIKRAGKAIWFRSIRDWRPDHDVVCVQAMLTPFDPTFLLMHGMPIAVSRDTLRRALAA